ncbi:uncharacterized protein M421DRAFT_5610 [Didymella exigua CBS 183.55]|uniref:Uncharacterized protein n=1 Tax=Didymella exigua CBS 183.55 TaxID=1150837 RepID=A0A6A5RLT6_9PLEO|nr:uncharacterized protein M421DRAFT_5610 [Didymella exigua CBS 183.55]KAF1927944.1 hypothetical protein M421DRAFT_5610 [Didymella exigua CBS 183.55]
MSGYRSFTHTELLSKIAKRPSFKDDFEVLLSIIDVVLTTEHLLPWILVGYVNLPLKKRKRLWAKFEEPVADESGHGNDRDFKLRFCLTDGTTHPVKRLSDIEVEGTFTALLWSAMGQLCAISLFSLLEKRHPTPFSFIPRFVRDFEDACSHIASGGRLRTPALSRSSALSSSTHEDSEGEQNASESVPSQLPSPGSQMRDRYPHSSSSSDEGSDDSESEESVSEADAELEEEYPSQSERIFLL